MTSRVALVTGGTGGIGSAICQRLADQGHRVATNYRDEAKALAWRGKMLARGCDVAIFPGDVSDPGTAEQMVQAVEAALGPIEILVNNAGITRDNLLLRMKDEDWQAILDTNLTSVYRTSKAVIRGMMKARKGRIINIASVIGVTGNAGQANYAAAKAGIIAFSKSLAKEIGSRGITVNVVAPGFIDTDMTKALPEEQRTGLVKSIALERLGEPSDIANAVAFLAGPSASYITGETLHVNGGMYMP